MHERDNVAIVANDGGLLAGTVLVDGVTLRERVPQAHKVALVDIAAGEPVLRYNVTIGHALRDIAAGSWVHERLLQMPAARSFDDLPIATSAAPELPPLDGYTFDGYRNADGSVGTRNILAITTTVQCVAGVVDFAVKRIKDELLPRYPNVDDVVALEHTYGCGVAIDAPDAVVPIRTLRNISLNPNFGGEVMVVSLGCEKLQPERLLPPGTIAIEDRRGDGTEGVDVVRLQDDEHVGFMSMVDSILAQATPHLERLIVLELCHVPVAQPDGTDRDAVCDVHGNLDVLTRNGRRCGLERHLWKPRGEGRRRECQGARCVARGRGARRDERLEIVSQPIELFAPVARKVRSGTERQRRRIDIGRGARRTRQAQVVIGSVNADVAHALIREMAWYDCYLDKGSVDRSANTTPGNKAGGLSNIVEKAMGSIVKSGSAPIAGVLAPGEKLGQKGLIYAATPASDFICGTLQLAAGMNLHVFTTGRGTPYGLAAVPVIKMSTRSELARRWHDLMDLDAGRIATGEATIADIGWELFHLLLEVASGRRKTWAEHWKLHNALVLFNPAPVT